MSIDQSKRINLWLEIRYEDKIYFSESVANGDIGDLLPVECYGCRLWCPHVGTDAGIGRSKALVIILIGVSLSYVIIY